jgi:hypothetical protein
MFKNTFSITFSLLESKIMNNLIKKIFITEAFVENRIFLAKFQFIIQ